MCQAPLWLGKTLLHAILTGEQRWQTWGFCLPTATWHLSLPLDVGLQTWKSQDLLFLKDQAFVYPNNRDARKCQIGVMSVQEKKGDDEGPLHRIAAGATLPHLLSV